MASAPDDMNLCSIRRQEMADELSGLLVQQLARAKEGNLAQVEQLAARADALVAGMVQGRDEAPVLTESQKTNIQRLYRELVLSLRAERGEVQAKLKQVRQVKRAVGAYGRKAGT